MNYSANFDETSLSAIFPPEKTRDFFEALFGNDAEGAFDIRLSFKDRLDDQLHFEFELHERPGKCLSCNLTYGLPEVFSRHPVIDVKGIVSQIDARLPDASCVDWKLGTTREESDRLHCIPLLVTVKPQEP
ncbi:MAG: pancreas/duodenum homeobox protein 1 [Desulfohalobiaceae bacterium]|nr:pancreas/duodenum homeobox protein 1 [Desulfohalobiaceae bacterium]